MRTATATGKYLYCIIPEAKPKSFGSIGIGGRGDVAGEITISVAEIELIYVGLNLVLGSVESLRKGDLKGLGEVRDSISIA